MINIEFTGTKSDKLKQFITDACEFYMKQLGFRKRKRQLDIFINIGKEEDLLGLCEFNQDYTWPEISIHLNRDKNKEEMLKTLAHELTHAKQFLRRELVQKRDGKMYWHGVQSDKEEWEDEAYIMEDKLYNEYVNERTKQTASNTHS